MDQETVVVQQHPETFIEKLRDVSTATHEDFRHTDLRGKLFLGSLALMTVYEWGPGNETITPIIAGQAIDAANGVGGAVLTAAIAGGFTFAQQLSSSWLSRRSAAQFPKTSNKAFTIMNDSEEEDELRFKSFNELAAGKKALYSFIMGASFNVLREAAVTGETDQQRLRSVGRKSAAITAGLVTGVALAADIVDQTTPEGSVFKTIINIAKTPWPWLAIMGGVLGKDYVKTKRHQKNK